MLRGDAVDEHVCLRRDNRRIDESQEKKATDERADRDIGHVGIFALQREMMHVSTELDDASQARTYPRQAPDLLADPTDTIWYRVETVNDRGQERICDLDEHRQSRLDDRLHVQIGSCDLG